MEADTPTRVAVVVPSYRRPHLLISCLGGIADQTRPPEEVVVVARDDDADTHAVLADWPDVRTVRIEQAGVIAAMRAGVAATNAEIVAFVDDDARPRPEWLAMLLRHLSAPEVGAAGGRDVVERPEQTGPLTERVGELTPWGRLIGNHHLGRGQPRDVAVLKGVNMAFRRTALALPEGLRGDAAQVDFELASCLWAAGRGWRLVYDPAALVDHAGGPRFGADQRGSPQAAAVADAAFNRLAILLSLCPTLGIRRAAFGLLVGEGATPGLARAAVAAARGEREVLKRVRPSLAGQRAAIGAYLRGRRVRMAQSAAAQPPASNLA